MHRQAGSLAGCIPVPCACAAPHRQALGPSQRIAPWQRSRGWEDGRQSGGSSSSSSAAHLQQQRRRQRALVVVTQVAALKAGGTREQLPIFPLSIVALPAADVPLQIFEARYRVLFNTLMAGAKGIEEGLVNPDKAWCGSRLFGMSFYDPQSQGLASIGTLLEITDHANLEDGRLLVNNVGRQRFKILQVVEEKPVLICEVEYLPDERDESASTAEARTLAASVAELFRSVVLLSVKLKNTSVPADIANPKQLSELEPCELSFWVASLFAGNPYQQQALLEEETTMKRLKVVEELLNGTVKYLSAQAALQSAFKTTSGSGDGGPPLPGGPD